MRKLQSLTSVKPETAIRPELEAAFAPKGIPLLAVSWRASGSGRCSPPAAAGTVRPRLDVRAVSEEELAGALSRAAGVGFDLRREVPLRGHLFALSGREHVLLLLMHHIAGDGWSLSPLLRDLGRCYQARRSGEAPDLAVLPVQYADYTLWQREVLGRESDGDSALARQLVVLTQEG